MSWWSKTHLQEKERLSSNQFNLGRALCRYRFQRGDYSTNHDDVAISMLKEAVPLIREALGEDIPIIVRMDSGYYDQKYLKYVKIYQSILFVLENVTQIINISKKSSP